MRTTMSLMFRSWIQLLPGIQQWNEQHTMVRCLAWRLHLFPECWALLWYQGIQLSWRKFRFLEYLVSLNCVEYPETSIVLVIPLTPACSNICLLVKSDSFTASCLMVDIWRLDIFRFTPLSHLFRVWLVLAMNLHSSMDYGPGTIPLQFQWIFYPQHDNGLTMEKAPKANHSKTKLL